MARRLHIGADEKRQGWEIFNIVPSDIVDHVGDASDLSRFSDGTFIELYASHVLEHFDYLREAEAVLAEWQRVLTPGGKISISVPNLDVLCHIFTHQAVTFEDKYKIMRVIFGGHMDQYDHHKTGYFPELLHNLLTAAGFHGIATVEDLNLFVDSSTIKCAGMNISLNMTARKPMPEK